MQLCPSSFRKFQDEMMAVAPAKTPPPFQPWSCDITKVFIIDTIEGNVNNDEKEPYTGAWKESLSLYIEVNGKLPGNLAESCDQNGDGVWRSRFHANKPLMFITSHSQYYGMWHFKSAQDNILGGKKSLNSPNFILCHVPYYAETWEPNLYAVEYDENSQEISVVNPPNVQVKTSIDQSSKAQVFLAPPLKFYIRSTVFSLDDIQTAHQTFRTSVFIELRLRHICTNRNLVPLLMKDYGFNLHLFEVLNVVEHTSPIERWENGMRDGDSYFDYSFKYRYHSVLGEEYELADFPFDLQDISIVGTLNLPTSRASLINNQAFYSIYHEKSFRLGSTYKVTYNDQVHVTTTYSDANESSAGHVYPRVIFNMKLTRLQGYYAWNIVLPMAVLTTLTSLSIGVEESDGSRLSTGDRLQITLTLLLTSVAFKFVVAESLPRVSYQTILDKYILMCNAFICVGAIENVLYPALTYDGNKDGKESFNEWFVMLFFLVSFFIANVVFWFDVNRSFRERVKMHEEKRLEEQLARERRLTLSKSCDKSSPKNSGLSSNTDASSS